MTSALIPEKPLVISPSLATTIGLEEATMLTILGDIATLNSTEQTVRVNQADANRLMPFWQAHDIQRISNNLRDKGIVALLSAPFTQSLELYARFAEGVLSSNQRLPPTGNLQAPARRGANIIAANWQPDSELLKQIAQYNIPESFVRQQLPEFITYWRERGESHHAWGAKFLKLIIRKWGENRTELFQRDQETSMLGHWHPSEEAFEVLVKHAGINQTFVEDAIPEFVLYWQERGDVGRTWNSRFIQHVKRQWARFTNALEHDTHPKPLPENWQPSPDVYDVLRLANIDLKFAQQQAPEFTLYWRDSHELQTSWNTKFLQHVKYQWAKQHSLNSHLSQAKHHEGQQPSSQSSHTRDRSLVEDLTDRSWAS